MPRGYPSPEPEPSPTLFSDSRRLLGANPYFGGTGAALEAAGIAVDATLLDAWRARIAAARAVLGWPDASVFAHAHVSGATLAFAAPLDQLFAATDVNEWAWLASAAAAGVDSGYARFHAPGYAAAWDEALAMATLRALALSEANPRLIVLERAAQAHRVALLIDDDALTLGEGFGARSWPPDALPDADGIDWSELHDVPLVLVTGTNGKTTTVRLLAAMMRAHGLRTGYSCTDGLFVDAAQIAAGDYSGPAGARAVLRHPDVQAAILETARGGLLRRGLAMQHAQAAIVTNLSADHYGAYGVHDLDALARVKLTVARVVDRDGLLVLNADDATLRARVDDLACAIGWFALDDGDAWLETHRARGGPTCGVRNGRVRLTFAGEEHDLGAVDTMPLSANGQARYNIANILAASLAAGALGIASAAIAEVLARFGAAHADNPGRLQRWSIAGVDVWLDYAHNPDGLRGLLQVAGVRHTHGRFGLLLGQAGDRSDADIRALAATAAAFKPARVVLKDIAGMLRGRVSGEVAAILRETLLAEGITADALPFCSDELEATRALLAWAQPGDILVLPIHGKLARAQVASLLDRLVASAWHPQQSLPAD
ncbi:MAG TPA: Mur ligase family protein [Xanthomonadaceae bacterium]|nr:Mur ligase family protein [Xanthomonadaceae bacterium]